MEKILLLGASGHAKVLIDIVERQGIYQIAGLIDHTQKVGQTFCGYSILGSDPDLADVVKKHGISGVLIGIGDNFIRSRVVEKSKNTCPSITFVSVIHPAASVAKSSHIGAGTVLMAGAVVNPDCMIGEHCVLNTNSSLDHDSRMGNFSSLEPNSATGGDCQIGPHSVIGIGATVARGITIGEHTVIGAGAVVIKDIPSHTLAYGVPATVQCNRTPGERH